MASSALVSAEVDGGSPVERICDGGSLVLLGESAAVERLRSQIRHIAPHFRTALIHGEPGAGKEQVARCLHAASPGAGRRFVAVRAAVVADALVHSEQGTAGVRTVDGVLESACGGTLYLKGVGELGLELQGGLMRFLMACDERRSAKSPDQGESTMRMLAGSNQDLRALAAMGQFRQDLYAALSAVELRVPALRERAEDILALAGWLLTQLAGRMHQSPKALTDASIFRLQKARWPGNLRHLERVVCQAAAIAEGARIEPRHLLAVEERQLEEPVVATAGPERLQDVIQQHVFVVLGRCGGNKLRAAERLGISRSTLYRMLDASGARATF